MDSNPVTTNKKKRWTMKAIEVKLISELMKNCRRSDRELAKALEVSQPTVSRLIKKLEKEGYIEHYTLFPNFQKIGFKIMAITLVKTKKTLTPEQKEKARALAKEVLNKGPYQIVMGERGMGLGYEGVFISYHKDFTEYTQLMEWFRQFEFLELEATESFLVDLEDKLHYYPLDFTRLADSLLITKWSAHTETKSQKY